MEKLYQLLKEDREITVDVYQHLPTGKMRVLRLLDAQMNICNEELQINDLPPLKLQSLEMRVPGLDILCLKAPEIRNTELMIF